MSKKFEVTILGVNSAFPVHGRHPSCQVVNYDERLYMIDCGEGAQIQFSKFKIKRNKLDHIFISHLHGDHCYGLPGLLTSFALGGRKESLYLHGPSGIKKFIDVIIEVTGAFMPFELIIKEYETELSNEILITPNLKVTTFPMKHRMPTMGFRFSEAITEFNINPEKIKEFNLSIEEIKIVKAGKSISREAANIPYSELIVSSPLPRSFSYCSDTVYDPELVPYIKNSSLLYHEATYLSGLETIAKERMHTTLSQAIAIAKSAEIERMIIGHYSSRYVDTRVFLDEGLPLFPGLLLGVEGETYSV
ncbi:MAG: ribonuclease Z [Saprospiraceae bacterium]|jgi:ribonuclease Z